MAQEFDVVVIGAGPGGYPAAIRASQLGLKTAIVEKRYWGGVCLNVGCIPSKALLYNAELAQIITKRARNFGIQGQATMDYGAAHKRSRQVANRLVKGVQFLMRKNRIERFDGRASFTDANTLEVALEDGGTETLIFNNAIIATGATTRLLPGTAVGERVVTYEEQIMSAELPGSIIIVGAGAIGVEFAYVLHNYGVRVTLVEYMARIVPLEDEEISAELRKQFERDGINILVGARVEGIEEDAREARVTLTDAAGARQTLAADAVMQAIGFAPRVEGYGLENTGVALTEGGAIDVNGRMQTSVPHLYAVGDVTMKKALAHVAESMGIIAAENIAGAETVTLDYRFMPSATYCQPQIASFGYTEAQAREAGYEVKVAKFPWQANGKALGMGESDGFVKLVSDKRYGEILGAHLIGHGVTELLPELTLAQAAELTPREIARNVHAHPTLGEALKEAAHGLEGQMINL
ncbi:MAG: dihydrolipoyl dehydrogenase [Anaerolineaceae bacterium]|nr:dihydrolipoyl dehydrogenase [Anaerolineaceae bacterium]MDE0329092.1 dihydrolipoyl dehydrogenase [Anaerolineaceae bacterium]